MRSFLAAFLLFTFNACAAGQSDRQQSQPLSVEAALHEVNIGPWDRPEVSRDGKLVAYSMIEEPPARSATARYGREIDILPNGMLASLYGAKLQVATVATGATVEMNPGEWSNWNGAFSPDSRQIAFLSDAGGTPQVWVADVATGKARAVSEGQIFVKMWNCLDRPLWSKDGKSIYMLVVEEKRNAAPKEKTGPNRVTVMVKASGAETEAVASELKNANAEIIGIEMTRSAVERVDLASGKRQVLTASTDAAQPYAYEIAPSEKWVSYLATKSAMDEGLELFVGSTSGGEPRSFGSVDRIIYDGPGSSQMYSAAFHWGPGSDRIFFVNGGEIWTADLAQGINAKPSRLAAELGKISAPPSASSGRVDQIAFTSDGKTLVARLADTNSLAFAVVPLDGSPAHRIVVTQKMRFLGMVFASRDILWQPKADRIVLMGSDFDTGKRRVMSAELSSGATSTLTEEAADFDFVSSASPNSIVVAYTNATTPDDLYEFDSTLQHRKRISHVSPALDGLVVGSNVTFTTRVPSYDGTMRTLKTGVLLPAGYQKGQRLPAIVHIYPDNEMSKDVNKFGGGRLAGSELAQFWTTRGYAVILPDLLPLTPQLAGGGSQIREIRDYLLPQINHAAELGYIDLERVVLTGHSYGGYGTTAILTETSLFRAGVAYSPAPLDLFTTSWTEWPGRVARIGVGANPWTAFKQYVTNSPYAQADKIRTPILFIHGTEDNVPPESSKVMFQGLEQLGKTAQLALYEGEPHYIAWWSKQNAIDATERVLKFITRYAPPGPRAGE